MELEVGTWDSVLLENLSEDSFINNIHQRYKCDRIYTYIGTSVVAVNPYQHISERSLNIISNYGSRGIFQLPPHIYGLTNLAYESLIDQKQDQCILLMGESGSGKTESFKMIVNFLTQIQIQNQTHVTCTNPCNSMKWHDNATHRSSSCSTGKPINDVNIPDSYCKYRRSNISNVMRHCKSNTTLNDYAVRGQSTSEAAIIKQCCDMTITPQHHHHHHHSNGRAESVDRYNSGRHIRDKIVNFDFSRHKSIENLSIYNRGNEANTVNTLVTSALKYNNNRIPTLSLGDHPTKSCFKQQLQPHYYQHQATQISCMTTVPSTTITTATKGSLTTSQLHANTSPKFSNCSSCQAEWHQQVNQRRGSLSITSNKLQGGSCTNLMRQHSTESYTQPSERLPHISLYDAYKMNQKFLKSHSKGGQQHLSTSLISTNIKRDPLKYLRECVSYADVFLEAMGNAVTLKNTNASRYGKLFDIEIDFKGDPIGVHIIHYSHNRLQWPHW